MYQAHVPEQVIKEINGHRSDCVRVYKRTNGELLEEASASIGGQKKRKVEEIDQKSNEVVVKKAKIVEVPHGDVGSVRDKESLSAVQIIKNVIRTRMEMRKKNSKKIVSKLAKRILKSKKGKIGKKLTKVMQKKVPRGDHHIVIDVNLNVKYSK